MKPPLKVWVFSDGRPGHFNQSRGLLKVLRLRYEVDDQWFEVRLRAGILRCALRYVLNTTQQRLPLWWLKVCYRIPRLPAGTPDLIISAGGKTSFINAWMARHLGSANVFSGSLRGLSDHHFGTVFTLEPIRGATHNVVLEHIPTTIDPEDVQQAGRKLRKNLGAEEDQLWAMVIGGDGAGYHYTPEDWRMLASGMAKLAFRYRVRWLVTSSRRTGLVSEQTLAEALPAKILAESAWYQTDPRNVVQSYMGAAQVVFCTEDSMSMITEGVASGRPVFTLSPERFDPEERFLAAIGRMEARRRLRRHPISQLGSLSVDGRALASFRPVEQSSSQILLNHLQQVLERHRHSETPSPARHEQKVA